MGLIPVEKLFFPNNAVKKLIKIVCASSKKGLLKKKSKK